MLYSAITCHKKIYCTCQQSLTGLVGFMMSLSCVTSRTQVQPQSHFARWHRRRELC